MRDLVLRVEVANLTGGRSRLYVDLADANPSLRPPLPTILSVFLDDVVA